MLQSGQTYTFHVADGHGGSTFVGRFHSYTDDHQGRPTMFTIARPDSDDPAGQAVIITTLLADRIVSIDHGDTTRIPALDQMGPRNDRADDPTGW